MTQSLPTRLLAAGAAALIATSGAPVAAFAASSEARPLTVQANVPGNWKKINGFWYFLKPSGQPYTNKWIKSSGSWYYFGADGRVYHDKWLKQSGAWYYFAYDGKMLSEDWYNDTYYFGRNGKVYVSKWLTNAESGDRFYFKANGRVAKGWQTIGGAQYYFYADGAMATDDVIDGKYLGKDGKYVPGTDVDALAPVEVELSAVNVVDPAATEFELVVESSEPIGNDLSVEKVKLGGGFAACKVVSVDQRGWEAVTVHVKGAVSGDSGTVSLAAGSFRNTRAAGEASVKINHLPALIDLDMAEFKDSGYQTILDITVALGSAQTTEAFDGNPDEGTTAEDSIVISTGENFKASGVGYSDWGSEVNVTFTSDTLSDDELLAAVKEALASGLRIKNTNIGEITATLI